MFDPTTTVGPGYEFGYLAGSPALGSSSSFPAMPYNRGYNQELNTTVPFAYNFAAAGTGLQNPSSPFLANQDVTFSWVFVDPDPIDEDPLNPGNPRQTNFIIEIKDNAGNAVVPAIPFDSYDAVAVGGASAGWATSFTLPAGTLPTPLANTTYRAYLTVVDAIGLEGGTFDDALQTNPVPYIEFVMQANSAPTASNFTVDGSGPNPAVNNVNPVFGFTYNDLDGDDMNHIIVDVYRITANCAVNCPPLGGPVPNSGGLVPGLAVASVGIPKAALAGTPPTGTPVTFNLYDLLPLQELLIANETYVWYLRVRDDQGNLSTEIYNDFMGAGAGLMRFTTVPLAKPAVGGLAVASTASEFKDNTVSPRVVSGTVAAPPDLRFTYNGWDEMKSLEVRVVRNDNTQNPQGDYVPTLPADVVVYTGIIAAGDPSVTDLGSKQYRWAFDPAELPLTPGETYYAQVRVYNQLTQASDWAYIEFTPNQSPDASLIAATWTVGPVGGNDVSLYPLQGPLVDNVSGVVFKWQFIDGNLTGPGADEGQTRYEIEIWNCSNFEQAGCTVANNRLYYADVATDEEFHLVLDKELEYSNPPDVFYVRMKVYDGLGLVNSQMGGPLQDWIAIGSFRTPENANPTVTVAQTKDPGDSPVANFTIDETPTFDWVFTDPEGRDQFQYSMALWDVTGAPVIYPINPGTDPVPGNGSTYTFDPAHAAGFLSFVAGNQYQFRVTVWDAGVDAGTDAVNDGQLVADNSEIGTYNFTFATLPSAPAALSVTPTRAGGTLVSSLTPTFNFTPADLDGEASVSYTVELGDAGNTPIDSETVAGSFATVPATPVAAAFAALNFADLTPNTTYSWRVQTTDQHGDGAWSAWQAFTVNPVPSAPVNLDVFAFVDTEPVNNLPNGNAGGELTFTWEDDDFLEVGQRYFIEVRGVTDGGFAQATSTISGTSPYSWAVPGLVPGHEYEFRVTTSDLAAGPFPDEFSPASAWFGFRVSAPPTIAGVDVTTKTGGLVNTVFPTFNWTHGDPDTDDMSAYRITVSRTTENCAPNCPTASPGTPFLAWDSGMTNLVVADGDPVAVVYGALNFEGIRPNESYSFTIQSYDANGIASLVHNGAFTTSANLPTGLSDATMGTGAPNVAPMDHQGYLGGSNFLTTALNVASPTPTFAWAFGGPGTQTRYQVQVSTDPTFADAGQDLWNVTVVSAAQTALYAGDDLTVETPPFYARLRVENTLGVWSSYAYFKFEINVAPNNPAFVWIDGNKNIKNTMPNEVPFASRPTSNDRTPVISWPFADANLTDGASGYVIDIFNSDTYLVANRIHTVTCQDALPADLNNPVCGTSYAVPANILDFSQSNLALETSNYWVEITIFDRYGVANPASPKIRGHFKTPVNNPPTFTAIQAEDGTASPDQSQVLSRTPNFSWSGYSDPESDPQGFSRVVIRDAGMNVVYDSGAEANAAAGHTFDASNCVTGGCPEFVWGAAYQVEVHLWDDRYDPVNFPGDPYASVVHNYTVSVYNRTPSDLVINPATVFQNGASVATATMSTPGAWATLLVNNGMTESFVASVQDTDFDGEVIFNLNTSVAGNFSFRVFETPVAVANPGDLGALIGASFESATLEVVPGAIVIGDANLSGSIWANPPTNTIFDQADVVATLQYTVALVELTSAQMLRANVDNSADLVIPGDRVNVGDVILMQQRSLGLIPCYPHPLDAVNCPPKMADGAEGFTVELGKGGFDWSGITSDVASGLVEMPITVKGDDVQGYQLSIAYGETGITVQEVRFGDGAWTSVSNDAGGVLKLTGVTTAGVGRETVATVVFNLNGSQQAKVSLSGMVNTTAVAAEALDLVALPTEYALGQNYPNPFNPSTQIKFSLPEAQNVVLEVYTVTGQKVATLVNRAMNAGEHIVSFNAGNLSSGVYIYRIQAGSFRSIHKMTLIK